MRLWQLGLSLSHIARHLGVTDKTVAKSLRAGRRANRLWQPVREGTLEQRKEFLRGFVHEISIDPDTARGVITFYELPISSLMMVPGARVQLLKTFRSKLLDAFSLPELTWRLVA